MWCLAARSRGAASRLLCEQIRTGSTSSPTPICSPALACRLEHHRRLRRPVLARPRRVLRDRRLYGRAHSISISACRRGSRIFPAAALAAIVAAADLLADFPAARAVLRDRHDGDQRGRCFVLANYCDSLTGGAARASRSRSAPASANMIFVERWKYALADVRLHGASWC